MKLLIKNAKVVTPTEVFNNYNCLVTDGYIDYLGIDEKSADKTLDARGGYLLAGFIDLHCHGGNGLDFMDASVDEMYEISRFHLLHGTTSMLATTMTDTWDNIESALKNYSDIAKSNALTLEGVHLEGPWFSKAQSGAQDVSNMGVPSVNKISKILQNYPFVKRISLAPELENAMEVGRYCKDNGVVVSAGHTDADFDKVVKASKNGYTMLTHFYSGMSSVVRKNAYRVAGAVEAGYYLDDLFVEIIADGKHLPESLLKLIYKIKCEDKICLITDGTRGSGLKDGQKFKLGRLDTGVDCIVEDGVAKLPDRSSFAGSVATYDRLVKTMLGVGIDIVSVSKMASAVPAKIMGWKDRGSIEIGKIGNLVITDGDFNIKNVILKGELQ